MTRTKKNILGLIVCGVMALFLNIGSFGSTPKTKTVYAAEINTVADVVETNKDFPNSIDNAWLEEANPKRKVYVDYSKELLIFLGTDGDYETGFDIPLGKPLDKDGTTNNYVSTYRDSDVTFVMDDGALSEIIVKSMWGYSDCNGTYAPPKTIADILNTVEFPTTKNNGWISSDEKNVVYLYYNAILRFEVINDSTTTFNFGTECVLEQSNGNYVYQQTGLYEATCTFIINNKVLSGFELTSSYRPSLSGTYLAPHVHAISETYSKVEPTCLSSGHEAYYECDCGKYFADETLNEEILNLETWLAEDGDGYIDPLGHDFGGTITYTWNEETHECTASWKCQREGCNETQTETVIGSYVMDTPATCLENEKGHFEATFSITDFVKQSTAANSYTKPDSALGHDFGGDVTYTWNDDKCTASWKCQREGCNETQTETVTGVYVKDTDATTESNEKGHYEATFSITDFVKQSTPANSVEIPNSKLSKEGLSGGAIAGISIGAVAGAALISYAIMFAVYAKTGKGLKFLTKSFDWLKKLFKMK